MGRARGTGPLGRPSPWPGGPELPRGGFDFFGTVRDRVAAVLRGRLLSGELVRGARIDLDELAEEFGTSRTPIREALLVLEHDGLVDLAPRSRATVVGLSPQDARDNFTLMAVLSGLAAYLAAQRIDDADLEQVVELGRQLDQAEGDELIRLNWQFHREINLASRSAPLLTQLRMSGQLVPQTFFDVLPEQVACSRVEHKAITQALAERDPNRLRAVTEEHFWNAGRLLSARIEGALTTSGADAPDQPIENKE